MHDEGLEQMSVTLEDSVSPVYERIMQEFWLNRMQKPPKHRKPLPKRPARCGSPGNRKDRDDDYADET